MQIAYRALIAGRLGEVGNHMPVANRPNGEIGPALRRKIALTLSGDVSEAHDDERVFADRRLLVDNASFGWFRHRAACPHVIRRSSGTSPMQLIDMESEWQLLGMLFKIGESILNSASHAVRIVQ